MSAVALAPQAQTPSMFLQAEPPKYVDDEGEYGNYAKQTGEKKITGDWLAAQVVDVAEEFAKQAQPAETFNHYVSGYGNGQATAALVNAVHQQLPELPITVSGKEFSGEHLGNTLQNFAEVFAAQQNFAFAVTNSLGPDAPTLSRETPKESIDPSGFAIVEQRALKIIKVRLKGTTTQEFSDQLASPELKTLIVEAWATQKSKSGKSMVSSHQALLVVSREDRDAALENTLPHINDNRLHHTAELAHAFRLAAKDEVVANTIAPIAKSLAPGLGKAFVIRAAGENTGENIVREIHEFGRDDGKPALDTPFKSYDHWIDVTQTALGEHSGEFTFTPRERLEFSSEPVTAEEATRLAVYAGQVPQPVADRAGVKGVFDKVRDLLAESDNVVGFANETLEISRAAAPAAII